MYPTSFFLFPLRYKKLLSLILILLQLMIQFLVFYIQNYTIEDQYIYIYIYIYAQVKIRMTMTSFEIFNFRRDKEVDEMDIREYAKVNENIQK